MIKLNNLDLKHISEELVSTFIEAGQIAKEISQRGVKITIKADNTPVTDGDLEVDRILRHKIKNLTPNIPIISEETVDLNKKNRFIKLLLSKKILGMKLLGSGGGGFMAVICRRSNKNRLIKAIEKKYDVLDLKVQFNGVESILEERNENIIH